MQLILASSSETRKKILKSLGLKFKVVPSHLDESKISATNPKLLVQKLAKAKAETVTQNLKLPYSKPTIVDRLYGSSGADYLILAADSMALLGSQTIGKPKNRKDAERILKLLSNKTHQFITGLYIINTKTNQSWQKLAVSQVTFKKINHQEIEDYVSKNQVTRYAGGYAIVPPKDFNFKTINQGQSKIIKKVEGSLTNVMGLPVEVLLPILRENQLII